MLSKAPRHRGILAHVQAVDTRPTVKWEVRPGIEAKTNPDIGLKPYLRPTIGYPHHIIIFTVPTSILSIEGMSMVPGCQCVRGYDFLIGDIFLL